MKKSEPKLVRSPCCQGNPSFLEQKRSLGKIQQHPLGLGPFAGVTIDLFGKSGLSSLNEDNGKYKGVPVVQKTSDKKLALT